MSEPSHFHANLQRGALLLNQNRPNEALPFLQAAIAANPDAPQGYAELARCWNEIPSQRWKAIGAIDRAIALAPNVSFFHGRKGWFFVCLLRYRGAILAAQDGLALNPHCPQSLNALANAYTKLNQWKKAEEVCRRILADDPNETAGLNLLAQALRHQGKWKETRQVIDHLLANVPNDAFGQANAGYAALAAGDHLRANDHFLAALRMDPHFDLARRGLLQSLRARNWVQRLNMRFSSYMQALPKGSPGLLLLFLLFVPGGSIAGIDALLKHVPSASAEVWRGYLETILLIPFLLVILWIALSMVVKLFGNFMLLFDAVGRHALTKLEKRDAIVRMVLFGPLILLLMCAMWPIALAALLLFFVVALMTKIQLLRDRWLRRRIEQAGN